jgi:hypothetical protein
MPIPKELFNSIGNPKHLHNYGYEARLQLDCVHYKGSQENDIPWK